MRKILMISVTVAALASCSKDKDPLIIVPPSSGSSLTLDGGNGGASAENSVYVDFSTDKQTPVKRNSWDLGFYCGSNFRVILNNTKVAFAKVTNKTDINAVGVADTSGVQLIFNHASPQPLTSGLIDDLSGDLNKTVIPAISAADAENKVVIINRWNDVSDLKDSNFVKVRILQHGSGYTLQYALLNSSTYKTLEISKNDEHDFVYASFTTNNVVNVSPAINDWDIQWGYSTYKTNFGVDVIYPFSDLVTINTQGGVQAFQALYSDETTAAEAFTKFNKDSVAKYTFSGDRWTIGSNWRLTVGSGGETAGIRKNRFYIIKDAAGNVYKLKFIAMGVGSDSGERGKPQIQYELIK
ncbi:MAG TPA: HmuY family protein [Niabella sp.]